MHDPVGILEEFRDAALLGNQLREVELRAALEAESRRRDREYYVANREKRLAWQKKYEKQKRRVARLTRFIARQTVCANDVLVEVRYAHP